MPGRLNPLLGVVGPQPVNVGGQIWNIPLPVQAQVSKPVKTQPSRRRSKNDILAALIGKTTTGFGIPGSGNIPFSVLPKDLADVAAKALGEMPIGWNPGSLTRGEMALLRQVSGDAWQPMIIRQRELLGDQSWVPIPGKR
jgi:hypothetical protein